jgi:hypothetical protein
MKTVLTKLLLVMLIAVTIVSCSKEEVEVVNSSILSQSTERITSQQKNEARTRFAKALAKASSNRTFTNYLNTEALRELTGDREVLYANIKNNVVTGTGKEVYEFLAATELDDVESRDNLTIDPVTFSLTELLV